jgi:hypothetical protein
VLDNFCRREAAETGGGAMILAARQPDQKSCRK